MSALNITLDDTSPLIRYTPVVTSTSTDASSGWTSICNAVLWRCDEHSAHSTGLDGATFALSFWGTSITLYGNVTLGMNFTVKVDGTERGITPGSGGGGGTGGAGEGIGDGQILSVVSGLKEEQHTLVVTAKKGGSGSLLVFDKAEVILGKATSVTRHYFGIRSPSIIYGPQPNLPWSTFATYNGTITPHEIDNTTYIASDKLGATFYHKFQGTAFFWYGPCYTDTCAYTAVLDGTANSQPQQFNASVPYGQVIEGCLRYYSAGLSSSVDGSGPFHEFLATNSENHWMTLGWLEVWDYQVDSSGGGGSGTGPTSNAIALSWSSSTFALLVVLYSFIFNIL